ncbi:helix-turn-helix transcriptional regulator [Clostridium sp. AN503]|uniref:helix-turn-helix domain-containing protein n=1 Tax=Clostridium sp. AN503 TaxID=3160598 RepID=UPI0034579A9C
MNLADRIQYLRKSRGISQEELADKIGVSRQAVSKWESSQSSPDIEKIILLSEYFNTTADYLLKGTEPKENETKNQEDTRLRRDALLFSVIGTTINAIGLIEAITIWMDRQIAYSVFAGLTVMAVGTMTFAVGQMAGFRNRKRARTLFALINVWLLTLMPLSCCFNILDGLLGGFTGRISPLPGLGNSYVTFGLCWLFYIVFCTVIDVVIIKRRSRDMN